MVETQIEETFVIKEKIYIILCTFFTVLLITGNLIYQKFIVIPILPFHTFELSAGAVIYPLTFLLTDLIAEFYGKHKANFCVKLAISLNIAIALIIMFVDRLDATNWSKIDNTIFHKVFGAYNISFIASTLACYTAQIIDINIYLWIRKITKNRYLWIRNNLSTAVSLFIDTLIVISFMSFFNILPEGQTWNLIFNSYSFKLFFTIFSTPIFYISAILIKSAIRAPNSLHFI